MNGQTRILSIVVVATAVIILSQYTFALSLPDSFYGSLMINGNPAPSGTQIRGMISGVDKTFEGPYFTSTSGQYGSLTASGKFQVQGDTSDQTIIFEIKTPDMSSFVAATPTGLTFGGGKKNINLTVTIEQECVNGQTQQCGSTDAGACEFGTQTCSSGLWGACVGSISPVAETCNNIDDDCDGLTDETFNAGAACSAGTGVCESAGTLVCNEAGDGTVCNAIAGQPQTETCDNVDNDCDGTTDEQLVQQCGSTDVGACEFGTQTCFAGQWSVCENNIEPTAETCNSVDDDCDGSTDETFVNLGSSCSAGTGVCESVGTFVCSQDGLTTTCNAVPSQPQTETCDNLDNDCDGQTDELGTISCGTGACQNTVDACVNGQAQTCTPGSPSAETCNNIDDNCNGQTDEGLGTLSCGTGVCEATIDTCIDGQTQTCTPGQPSSETCDNLDNDCDGQTDELQPITCGVGACQNTVNACIDGNDNACILLNPAAELCGDGIDNDCDGSVDEGFDVGTSCSSGVGACQTTGTKVCSQDMTTTVCNAVAGTPTAEVCDNIDNNCDGSTDETFVNLGSSCSAGTGVCESAGTFICSQDGSTTVCNAQPGDETPEVCDNVDNDCDGTTDEQLVQQCGSTDVGACEFGTQTCFAGQWSTCENNIEPTAEVCDNADNDCDGITNEGFNVGQACSAGIGVCESAGTLVCNEAGDGTVCNAVPNEPEAEICDGSDNDCNGQTDEGLGTQTCGVGACQNTVNVCINGSDNACVPLDPSAEICNDQIDNDCDGTIDSADLDCQCVNNQTLSVTTDKNIYEVGSTVLISGMLDISCGSEANKQIGIVVKGPNGNAVFTTQQATSSQGAYSTPLSLENAETGEYEVQSAFNGSSSTKKFTVIQADDEDFCIVITDIQILNSTFNTTTSVGRGKFYNVRVSNTNVCNDPVETMQIIQVMKGTLPINLGTVTSTIAPGTTSHITLGFTMPQSADTGAYSANAFNWNHWIDQDPSSFKILSKSITKEFQVT